MRLRYLKLSDVYKYFLTFLIFLVIISSASIWIQKDVMLVSPKILRFAIWAISVGLILVRLKSFRGFYYLVLIAFCFIGYSVFNVHYIIEALYSVFIPVTLFYILGQVNSKQQPHLICECFVNVMCFLAAISLIFFVFASILKIIPPTGYLSYQWSWINSVPSYFHLYYEPIPGRITQLGIPKNCGIFPEAPMFNFPLCIALGFDVLLLEDENKRRRAILFATIITTAATSGFLFLIGLYGYLIIKKNGLKNVIFKLIATGAVAYVGYRIISNLLEGKTQTSSYKIRYDHLYACVQTIARTRFMGSGVGNDSILESYMSYRQGASLGLLFLLAIGGIFCTLLFLVPVIVSVIQGVRNKSYNIVCFAALFFMLVFLTQVVLRNNMWFVVGTVFMNVGSILIPAMEPSKTRTGKWMKIKRLKLKNI